MQRLGLEKQLAAGIPVAGAVQPQTIADVGASGAGQRIEPAARLARVAGDLGHALFVSVEFLQHDHRQEDVMFLEPEQTHRVVQQHVGVEHEQLGCTGRFAPARPQGSCRPVTAHG